MWQSPFRNTIVFLIALGAVLTTTQLLRAADTQAPIGTISINNGAAATNKTTIILTLSATDDSGTVSRMRFSNTGSSYSTAEAYARTKSWTLATGSGTKTVYAMFADAAGNWSQAFSDTIVLDTTAPTISAVACSGITSSGATITWRTDEASTSKVDYGTTTSYGQTTPLVSGLVTAHSVVLSSLTSKTRYNYRVRSVDAAGNEKLGSNSTCTTLSGSDLTPPTAPTGLTATAVSPTQVNLAWGASTDNIGVTAYRVYRGGVQIASTTARTYTDATVQAGTAYAYTVAAQDAAGNLSTPSATATVTTPRPDTTPPAAIVTLTVASCTDRSCTLSWTAPGDDGAVGTAATYDIRYAKAAIATEADWAAASKTTGAPQPAAAGTPQTFAVSGLTPATTYFFSIRATDEAANVGALGNSPTADTSAANPSAPFTFAVYGDSASGSSCDGNAVHIKIVGQIAAADPDFVVHLGDMIPGFANTTNWVQQGACTAASSNGSFKNIISPLVNRPVPSGLPANFFPVIGNHDDSWGDQWYPDPYKNGVCDAYGASLVRSLIPNHLQQPYFKDKTGRNYPILGDDAFYKALCATTMSASLYGDFFYYSFDYNNSHFVFMHINNDDFDLRASNTSCTTSAESNYDTCYNIHQLHWLQYDLAKAQANPSIRHIFGFLHAPIFTTGDGHPATASWKHVSQEFSKVHGDIIFSGHNHIYERTVPIYATAASPNGTRDDTKGTVYMVASGGGQVLYGLKSAAWFDQVRTVVFHHVEVTVDGDQVSIKAVDVNGNVIDSFVCSSCVH